MASTVEATPPPLQQTLVTPDEPRQQNQSTRGGARESRGNLRSQQPPAPNSRRPQHPRRGGRGRGGSILNGGPLSQRPLPPTGAPQPSIQSSAQNTQGKESESVILKSGVADEDKDAEVCFICASLVVHNSVAPCNHRTCHICALRLRALYKTRACAHCRAESQYVIFTDDSNKRYEEYTEDTFQEVDEILGIKYEQKEIHDDTVLLLRYNCPEPTCDIACWGWPDLHRHVKGTHHKVMCDLCTRNKKVFTHEHELFTIPELKKHEKFGDDNPGAVDQSGFRGHPECGFCKQRFYGDDELYTHCRDKHERCHICDRRNSGREQQYYVDYNALELHFRKDHFLCADQDCLDKKFVVFESEMDLKAHQLESHPNGLSKDARRDARRVDISGFDYRTPHHDGRGARRERPGGRGRDPNTEPLPQSSAQPLRRDELAYQRQMAIQSAQSVTSRNFGGQLTSTTTYTARPSRNQNPDTTIASRDPTASNASFPAINGLNLDPSTSPQRPSSPQSAPTLTPQEQARRVQHNAVMDRASALLKHDAVKISSFRNSVSSYRSSTLSASQLIDAFFSLFDVPSSDLGKLIKELADIYEIESKRTSLLKAWNDWRAINEDYPSLPGPSGILPGSTAAAAGSGGHRVLKLKNSTAQSSRSAVSKQGSWGNAANTNPFPPMAPASASRPGAGRASAVPWVASSASSRVSPAPSRPISRAAPASQMNQNSSTDAFPALPVAAKPNTLIAGLTRGTIRWDDAARSSNVSPWGNGGTTNGLQPPPPMDDAEADGEPITGGKKKGNKNKKQTLYKFG